MKKTSILFALLCLITGYNFTATAQRGTKTELKATLAGISKGDISKDLLLSIAQIECSDPSYTVVYFTLSIMKSDDLIVYSGMGNTLTESMKVLIKGIEPGSKLALDEIGAKSTDEKIIKLPAIILTLR
jgi:hypothetical protein